MPDLPPRAVAAERRAHFRELLADSSLGDPEAQEAIVRFRREQAALPDHSKVGRNDQDVSGGH